jgi:UDP-glucose 4-epimerase
VREERFVNADCESEFNMTGLLVVGAGSRLGRSLMSLPNFEGAGFARNGPEKARVFVTDDYANLTPQSFEGYSHVINLTGRVEGSSEQLQAANVDLPCHLASCAKTAGVGNFIQISSFSLFGQTEIISRETDFAPVTAYGKSRVAGEMHLGALSDKKFSVTLVRIPMLYGYGQSKLERLAGFWRSLRVLPVPSIEINRAMIHYDLAAHALLKLAMNPPGEPVFLADPQSFEYRRAAEALTYGSGKKIGIVKTPAPFFVPLRLTFPGIFNSMLKSCALDPDSNLLEQFDMKSRIYEDIQAMGRGD